MHTTATGVIFRQFHAPSRGRKKSSRKTLAVVHSTTFEATALWCGNLALIQRNGDIMALPVHDLEAEILGLPAEDRARILELLIASFEPKSDAQKAWMNLALRRREEVRSGKVTMLPGDEALARVRSRIA